MAERLPNVGADDNDWGGIIRNFLLVGHNEDGTQRQLETLMSLGVYVGTGASPHAITDVGFQPDVVVTFSLSTAAIMMADKTLLAEATPKNINMVDGTRHNLTGSAFIESLDSVGFTLGSSSLVNQNNLRYAYWAFKLPTG